MIKKRLMTELENKFDLKNQLIVKIAESDQDKVSCFQIRTKVFVLEQGVDANHEIDNLDDLIILVLNAMADGNITSIIQRLEDMVAKKIDTDAGAEDETDGGSFADNTSNVNEVSELNIPSEALIINSTSPL